MKRLTARLIAVSVTSVTCLVAVLRLSAQTPAPDQGQTKDENETVIPLSPFVVEATEDQGYAAKDTLAGTRVRTELKDIASSISVVTQQFLQDTGSKNAQDLLVYTPNTEIAGLRGNYSGQGGNVTYSEALTNPSNTTRVRGLDSADNTRDYFLTDIPWDGFNVGRVDLQRGPNSILFGVGSPAGIINTSLNTAAFKNSNKVENVTSKYGSQRNLIDINYVLLPDVLALRFSAVKDDQKFQQKPAFNDSTRYYGALNFDPKIFNIEGTRTSIRANFEKGKVDSNNPRTIPPDDQITRWFTTGTDSYGVAGLNKLTINEYAPGWGAGSTNVSQTVNYNWAVGRIYWPTPVSFFNGSNPATPGLVPNVLSGIPTQVIIGELTQGWAIDANGNLDGVTATGHLIAVQPGGSGLNGIGGLPNFQPKGISPFSHYAAANIPGGTYYANKVLTDPSIYDFYSLVLDGPNKHEWQNWNAFNVALSQTFLHDRVGAEFAYDKQTYSNGEVGFLGGENYGINIDLNQVMANGAPNPNVGRPYVANAYDYGNDSHLISRDSSRFTLFGEVRASDFLGNTTLAKIIGRHVITGLMALDHKRETDVTWAQYAADPGWETLNNYDLSVKIVNFRLFNWVDYIGPAIGASTAANAHLTNVQNVIAPGANSSVTYFNSHWNHSLNPSDPGYVNPAALYTYLNSDTAAVVTSTQSNNPANYVGWQQATVNWMNASNPADFPSLVTGGTKTRFRDFSKALIWQGYFLDGTLVGTYGWRKDAIENYSTGAPVDPMTSIAALDYADDPTSYRATDGQTRTWGAVYHLPQFLMKHVPGDTTFSVFFNKSHNFKADAPRVNMAGMQIPNPDGDTKEYGFTLTTLSDKIALKVTKYETTVHFATLNNNAIAGLGGLGYYNWAIPSWGYGYVSMVQMGLDGLFGNTTLNGPGDTANGTSWNYVAKDAYIQNSVNPDLSVIGTPAGAATKPVATYGYGGTGAVTMTDIVNAWLHLPLPDNFFNFFGITGNRPVPALARSTGKLYQGWTTPATGNNLPGVGGQQPSGSQAAVSTMDNISKGWEYELSAQPIKNWNITVNYAKTQATKNNIDAITQKLMADNLAFYRGPGGQLRLWGASQSAGYGTNLSPTGPLPTYAYVNGQNNGSAVGPDWIAGVYNPYLVTATAQGQSAPEVSPWRLNLITTYSFDRGVVKGAFVGGAVRIEAGRILGYRYSTTSGILDVTKTLIGPNDTHYDLWVGYSSKFGLGRKINWRIQLNLRDVGTKSHLVPARYEPDGTLALARIQEGMTWQVTNTFEF